MTNELNNLLNEVTNASKNQENARQEARKAFEKVFTQFHNEADEEAWTEANNAHTIAQEKTQKAVREARKAGATEAQIEGALQDGTLAWEQEHQSDEEREQKAKEKQEALEKVAETSKEYWSAKEEAWEKPSKETQEKSESARQARLEAIQEARQAGATEDELMEASDKGGEEAYQEHRQKATQPQPEPEPAQDEPKDITPEELVETLSWAFTGADGRTHTGRGTETITAYQGEGGHNIIGISAHLDKDGLVRTQAYYWDEDNEGEDPYEYQEGHLTPEQATRVLNHARHTMPKEYGIDRESGVERKPEGAPTEGKEEARKRAEHLTDIILAMNEERKQNDLVFEAERALQDAKRRAERAHKETNNTMTQG